MRRLLLLAVVPLLVLAGCGSGVGVRTTGDPRVLPVELPVDGATPIVQIGRWLPVITADGHVYTDGSVATRQSWHAVVAPLPPTPQPVNVAQLTPAGLATVVRTANELGLLAPPPDYGDPHISDSGSLTVTLTTADSQFVHSAYAPDERTGARREDAARDRLQQFTRFLDDLDDELGVDLGPSEPYVPTQWIVDTAPHAAASDAEDWQFATRPVNGCATFPLDGGGDTATGVYRFDLGDRRNTVTVRPALPGEC